MDLDRSVNEVLGARFGGGGATGQQPFRSQVSEQKHASVSKCSKLTHSNTDDHFHYFLMSALYTCVAAFKHFYMIKEP